MAQFTRFVRSLSLFVAGVLAASSFGLIQATDAEQDSPHHFNRPDMNFASDPCAYELGVYLAAVGSLEAAQQVADDAWEALQDCIANNPPPPPTAADLAGTVSILE